MDASSSDPHTSRKPEAAQPGPLKLITVAYETRATRTQIATLNKRQGAPYVLRTRASSNEIVEGNRVVCADTDAGYRKMIGIHHRESSRALRAGLVRQIEHNMLLHKHRL